MNKIQKTLFILIYILFVMKAGFAETYTWTGAEDEKWNNSNNWKIIDLVPSSYPNTASDDVEIPQGLSRYPVINKQGHSLHNVNIQKLKIAEGAELFIECRTSDVSLKCASGIENKGTITIELKRGMQRNVTISKCEFLGSSELFIDSPSTPLFNSAYDTNLKASQKINFKVGSVISAGVYANNDSIIINTPIANIAGTCSSDQALKFENSSGIKLNISGTLTAKRDVAITDSTNTVITSSGNITLEKNLNLSNAKWNAAGGSVTTKGDFYVTEFRQTSGDLKLMSGATQNIRVKQVYNITVNKTALLQCPLIILGILENKGYFDSNGHDVNFTGTDSRIKGAPSTTRTGFTNLKISASAKLTLENDINIAGTFTNDGTFKAGGNTVIFEGSSSITGSNVIEFANIKIEPSGTLTLIKPITVVGTLTNNGTFNANGQTVMFSGSSNKITGNGTTNFEGLTIPYDANLTLAGQNIKVSGQINNNGIITSEDTSSVTFTGDSSTITSGGSASFANLTIDSGKKLTLNQNITIVKKFTNNGTFDAVTNNKTVTLNPPTGGTVTITGNTASNSHSRTYFNKLALTNAGGKTLAIGGNIKVKDLYISGSSYSDKLIVRPDSTGEIELTEDQKPISTSPKKGYYLDVRLGIPIKTGHKYYIIESSSSSPGWLIGHRWEGTSSTNWFTNQNWNPHGTPTVDSVVLIPSGCTNYPKLTVSGAKAYSVEVEKNAILDLADQVISNDPSNTIRCPIVLNGTVSLKGTMEQKNWFAAVNDNEKINLKNTSIVEYYGTSSADIWGGPYKFLQTAGRDILKTGNEDLTVYRNFNIKGSDVVINTGTGDQTYSGHISAEDGGTKYNITFTTAGTRTVQTQYNVTAKNITVTGDWHIRPTDDYAKAITADENINVSGTLNSGDVGHTGEVNIKLKGNFTADKFIQKHGTLIFEGNTAQTLTTTSSDSKIKKLKIESSATVNLGSDITITEMFENNGTFNAITNTVYLKHSESQVVIKGNGDKSKTQFRNLVCTGAGGKSIRFENKISVYGDLTLQGTAKTNLLNISGTSNNAEIYVNQDKNTGTGSVCKWLGVAVNLPIKSLDTNIYTCTTDESKPTGSLDDIIAGKPENWIFDNVYELRWTGEANDNDWNNPNNWRPRPSHAPKATQAVTVREVAGDKHPILGSGTYYAEKVEVVGTASLDLADKLIYKDTASPPVTTAKLENKGTLKLKGTDDQKLWFEQTVDANKMTVTQSSTVEYYGTSPATINLWGGGTAGYKNLILKNILSCTTQNSPLKVNGELTVKDSDVTINSGTASQTYEGDINAEDGTNYRGITFNVEKLISKKINAGNITVNNGSNDDNKKWESGGNVTVKGNIHVTGNWYSNGYTIKALKSLPTDGNINADSSWRCWGDITAEGDMTIQKIKATGGIITVKGNLTADIFHLADNGKLLFAGSSGQTINFTNLTDSQIRELEIAPASILNLSSSVKITYKFTNNGTFNAANQIVTLAKGTPIGSVLPPDNITITGNGTPANTVFNNLSCTDGIETLTIDKKISVSGDLILEGAAIGTPLAVNGGTGTGSESPEIVLSSNTKKGKWLNVKTNIPISGETYTVVESKPIGTDEEIYTDKKPENWIFEDCLIELRWVAEEAANADKTKWDKPKNWLPNGIPGVHTPVNILAGKNNYPKLESTTNAKAKEVMLNGELDLDAYTISDGTNTSPLTNNGLLKMIGTAGQKTWLEIDASNSVDCITHNSGSKIDYHSAVNNPIWDGPYKNLILGENRANLTAGNLIVTETLTVASDSNNPVITANSQTYTGVVTLKNNTTFNSTGTNGTVFNDKIEAAGFDITFSGAGKISTQKDITAKNISSNAGTGEWSSSGGTIKLTGDFTVPKFKQTGGTLSFTGAAQKLNISDADSTILNLSIEASSLLQLLSPITLISSFVNKGKFDAAGKDVTLKPEDTITITGKSNETDTKFDNLYCEKKGNKTFSVKDKISVNGKLNLSGDYISHAIAPLTVTGENGAIYLSHSQIDKNNQLYLKIYPDNIKINRGNINEKYYVADESTDNNNTTKNKNGWVFYKSFELVNSFARPNENKIYLLLKNGSTDGKDIELEEDELAYPAATPLQINNGASHVYTQNRTRPPKKLSLPSIPKHHTFWEFTIDDTLSPDWILDKNAIVYLDYYGKPKEKSHISDIGIDMVKPQMAFNSIVLRSFDAKDYDIPLPHLDVRIPTERVASSDNVTLHFRSTDSVQHRFWHPGTAPIGPASNYFAVPQSGTNTYTHTLENGLMNFVILEADPYLTPEKVGSFMYVYDGWLPCARLREPNNIFSFDAWHFKVVGIRKQRGGVSMFNNVINPNEDQTTVLEIQLKKSGFLTIQVMSVDGSIIKTIERDRKPEGRYLYYWDGKNQAGNPVARGIYFIRIAGPDVDETRKILIIR